jgi:probable HAF family extracellular repeat protein
MMLPISARAINDAGQVVGSTSDDYAVLYSAAGGVQSLDVPPGYEGSEGRGLNNVGQVVGDATDPFGIAHAFVWDCVNGMRDLNDSTQFTLTNPNSTLAVGWVLTIALAVNDQGRIVGWGYNLADQKRIFVLTPPLP